jgi:predicted permease
MRTLFRRLNRRSREREMREEMEFHLVARIDTLVERGMTREAATRTARIEMGNVGAYEEECRAALGYRLWDELRADLRFGLRHLVKQPGYTAAAVTILALAIGVNSALFTVFSSRALEPLAIRGADRHFELVSIDKQGRSSSLWTASEIEKLRQAGGDRVEDLYTAQTIQVLLTAPVQRYGIAAFVSGNYFQLLGARAEAGRTFSAAEQGDPVAVLSRSGARRHFPDNPAPIGETVRVGKTNLTVVGVMAPEFIGTEAVIPDLWIGSGLVAAPVDDSPKFERKYSVSGLLAPGASREQAEVRLSAAATHLPRPAEDGVARIELRERSTFLAGDGELLPVIAILFVAFLAVLGIACANLANLSLARAASRAHEIAMRLSLGASRARVVRQLLTESVTVALGGAGLGIVAGLLGLKFLEGRVATLAGGLGVVMPSLEADWRVAAFAAALGVLAGLAFGLAPAIEITSPSLRVAAKREQVSLAGRMRPKRMRQLLIAGQAGSSLVLLLLGGVLARHLQKTSDISPGYDMDRIFYLGSGAELIAPTTTDSGAALLEELVRRPEVAGASAVQSVPLVGRLPKYAATADGILRHVAYNHVDHRFFETLNLKLQGRSFMPREVETRAHVAVVSLSAAQTLWPGSAPVGQTVLIDRSTTEKPAAPEPHEVIGVAPDVMWNGWLFGQDANVVYLPAAPGHGVTQDVIVRIHGEASAAIPAIREVCAGPAHGAGCEPSSLREVSRMQRVPLEIAAAIAGLLGALGLAMTAVGLSSLIRYTVLERRREIGVLLVLGATPMRVVRRLTGEALLCVGLGSALGLPICLVASRFLDASVLGIEGFPVSAYLLAPALLAAITALACVAPARRAARLDPMASLREE